MQTILTVQPRPAWILFVIVLAPAMLAACGDSGDSTTVVSVAGAAGAGAAGAAGSVAGNAGAGASGASGHGGASAGSSGSASTGGSAGTAGVSGSSGASGVGGAGGTGGSGAVGGSGGASGMGGVGGSGGTAGSAGAASLPSFCANYPPAPTSGTWQSTRVNYDANGRLQYKTDSANNKIPDFSYAGYRHGEAPIPTAPVVKQISPISGDNTQHIQAAIDEVAALPVGPDGFRGAVLLDPGSYEVQGTIYVHTSGVVLRGAGPWGTSTSNSILSATGNTPAHRDVIVLGGKDFPGWKAKVANTTTNVTTDVIPLGATKIDVEDASLFSVGDTLILTHPITDAWLAAIDGGGASQPWSTGDHQNDIVYHRKIVAIDANQITLDVPVYNHLVRSQSQSSVYKLDRSKLATQVGVENLRVNIVSASSTDEDHAWSAIHVFGAEDSWVRNVVALHFGFAGVEVESSTNITVSGVQAINPSAIVEPGKLYNFAADHEAQQVLFEDCTASKGRHHFVSNGTASVSGLVFLRCSSSKINSSSEGHRRWSQALLFDSIVEDQPQVNLVVGAYNRGDYGTLHGWAAVHSVIWRHDTAGAQALVQKPPTAQNYAIGVKGVATGSGPFAGPAGYIEDGTGDLVPSSLYEAQLCDRLTQ